jgi:hypothetical protein
MRNIKIANAAGRDADIKYIAPPLVQPPPRPGLPGHQIRFRRYLLSAPTGVHAALQAKHGEDYAQALLDGDPEVDVEKVGREINPSAKVFLTSDGQVMHAVPTVVEVITDPDGTERDRREPTNQPSNVTAELPVVWTGKTMAKRDAVRKFVFTRTLVLRHTNGLSFDFLHAMAKELAESGEVVLVGAGKGGKLPLVLQENGTPYRGFLEGRVDGDRFALLLHLSNMELKRPAAAPPKAASPAAEKDAPTKRSPAKVTSDAKTVAKESAVPKKVAAKETAAPKKAVAKETSGAKVAAKDAAAPKKASAKETSGAKKQAAPAAKKVASKAEASAPKKATAKEVSGAKKQAAPAAKKVASKAEPVAKKTAKKTTKAK